MPSSAQAADTPDYTNVRALRVDASGKILSKSTITALPQGEIATVVKNNNLQTRNFGVYRGVYLGAYWLSTKFSGLSTPSQADYDGKRLPLKSLSKQDDGSSIVTPTDDVATSSQSEVLLTARSDEVANHAVLVYLDTASAKLIHFTYGGALTNKTTSAFSTSKYDTATDMAQFEVVHPLSTTGFTYKTTAYVKVPRGKEVTFSATGSDGSTQTVTPKLVSDDSSSAYTIQTYSLTVNELVDEIHVGTRDITSKQVKVIARMESEPVGTKTIYEQPQFNISYVDDGYSARNWNCGRRSSPGDLSDEERNSTCLPEIGDGNKKAVDYRPNGSRPGGGRLPRVYGFQTGSGGSSIAPNSTSPNDPALKISESAYQMTVKDRAVFTFEAIPALQPNDTDPDGYNYYQDFLSSVTITNLDQVSTKQSNAQTVLVPYPDLCRNPYGDEGTNAEYCYIGDAYWNNWTAGDRYKDRYSCVRAWMLGYRLTNTNVDAGCGAYYSFKQRSWAPDFSTPRVLLDYTIPYGANAGTRVIIKLLNARGGVDVGSTLLDPTAVSENAGAFPASINSSRWRTRYQVEVSNPQNPNMEVVANYNWTSQQRVLLGASSGIEPIDGSKDAVNTTAVSVYGVGNSSLGSGDVDGRLDWKSICVNGENRGVDGGANGGNGCRYVWQDQDNRTTMPLGFRVKNGFQVPQVLYAPERFTASGTNSFVQYTPQTQNPVSRQTDGNLYVDLPKLESTNIDFSEEHDNSATFHMNTRVPIYVHGQSVDIPLKYFDDQGSPLAAYTTDARTQPFADTTINVQTNPFRAVASQAPTLTSVTSDGKPQVFTHWTLQAYNADGKLLGTVGNKNADRTTTSYAEVSPRDLLRLNNPVFTSVENNMGVTVGGPVITNTAGEKVAAELRLVAVPMTASDDTSGVTTRSYDYYPVRHVVKDNGTHVVRAFDYTAVPGLDSAVTAAHIAAWPTETWNSNTYTYNAGASKPAIGDATNAWDAASNPGLTTPARSLLEMLYSAPGTPVAVTKAFDQPTLLSRMDPLAQPAPTDYALKLTTKADTSLTYTITAGSTSSAPIPEGTYTLSEVTTVNRDAKNIQHAWVAGDSGFSCHYGTDTATEQVKNGEITLNGNSQALNCTITNQTAAVSLVAYSADQGKNFDSSSYTFTFKPVAGTARIDGPYEAKSEISRSTGALTPGVAYKLETASKPASAYVTVQKYVGRSYSDSASASVESDWQDIDANNFTLDPDTHTILRVVVHQIRPELPLTGGSAADMYYLLGAGGVCLAAMTALVLRRRNRV